MRHPPSTPLLNSACQIHKLLREVSETDWIGKWRKRKEEEAADGEFNKWGGYIRIELAVKLATESDRKKHVPLVHRTSAGSTLL